MTPWYSVFFSGGWTKGARPCSWTIRISRMVMPSSTISAYALRFPGLLGSTRRSLTLTVGVFIFRTTFRINPHKRESPPWRYGFQERLFQSSSELEHHSNEPALLRDSQSKKGIGESGYIFHVYNSWYKIPVLKQGDFPNLIEPPSICRAGRFCFCCRVIVVTL